MKITEYVEIRTVPIDLSVIDQVLWGWLSCWCVRR